MILNSYFCFQCNMVHVRSLMPNETIFKTGFSYVNLSLLHAGICNRQNDIYQQRIKRYTTHP
ncbi:DUF3973 domain-containing protein [Paenibacillus sp. GCM10023248]|uniref:DUF3973 domain-containing protein n=1 Tax=unclassified Paenibacillus TaxID=185978 RepID=UPI00360756D3